MGEGTKSRDWLDYVDIFGKVVASVALPLALFFAGHILANQQALDADLRRREDRVTDLLKYLGSKEVKERLLGISVLRAISRDGKLPPELSTALVEIAVTDSDSRVQNAALTAVDAQVPSEPPPTVAVGQPAPVRQVAAVSGRQLPARLYVQIVSEDQRADADRIGKQIAKDASLVVPGIEQVAGARLTTSEVRYFWPEDKAEADQIADILRSMSVPVTVTFPERYARSGRPRHFELWLKPTSP